MLALQPSIYDVQAKIYRYAATCACATTAKYRIALTAERAVTLLTNTRKGERERKKEKKRNIFSRLRDAAGFCASAYPGTPQQLFSPV